MMKRIGAAALAAGVLAGLACGRRTLASLPATPAVSAMDRQVRNAVDAGEGDFPLRALRQQVIDRPDNLPARLELARAYAQRGYPELALEHYRLAADRFPASAAAHLALARTLRQAHLPQQALLVWSQFLESHPDSSPEAHSWLGIFRDDTGDWKGGETAHREALALAGNSAKDYLHNNLGYSLLMQGRKPEAAAEFRQSLLLNPASDLARDNLGLALANNHREAVLHWQSVGEPAAAHTNLAASLIEAGNYPEARREISRALAYNRNFPPALANLKLVSELDGKPAMIAFEPTPTRWSRVRRAVGRWFGDASTDSNQPESPVTKAQKESESPQ